MSLIHIGGSISNRMSSSKEILGININEPRYDQSTYAGRAKHFFVTTNPLNLFVSGHTLDEAKDLVERYRLVQMNLCFKIEKEYN